MIESVSLKEGNKLTLTSYVFVHGIAIARIILGLLRSLAALTSVTTSE